MQPLYPGQDRLVARTEAALSEIIPEGQRAAQVMGRTELEAHLRGQKPSQGCLTGEAPCPNPIDALVADLGFDRVVLMRGGQDESGYRFRVTSYRPKGGELSHAEASNQGLERALLGALVKVVPLASTLFIDSTPPGATVFIDGEKVGTTPLETQILPGERTLRLELGSHLPSEFAQNVPVRGEVRVARTLEKVPARLVVTARPEGAEIWVDGKSVGKDKVDQGIEPGTHAIRLSLEGFHPHEQTVEIAPGETTTVDRTLAPTSFTGFKRALQRAQEDIYERRSYFEVGFESAQFNTDGFTTRLGDNDAEVDGFVPGRRPRLTGVSVEYGNTGRHFGLAVIGASYLQGGGEIIASDTLLPESARFHSLTLRALQPQLRFALWRFTLGLQAGLDARLVQVMFRDQSDLFGPAGRAVDLQLSGQAHLRIFILEGLYLTGAARASRPVLSGNAGYFSFVGGAGYAF